MPSGQGPIFDGLDEGGTNAPPAIIRVDEPSFQIGHGADLTFCRIGTSADFREPAQSAPGALGDEDGCVVSREPAGHVVLRLAEEQYAAHPAPLRIVRRLVGPNDHGVKGHTSGASRTAMMPSRIFRNKPIRA